MVIRSFVVRQITKFRVAWRRLSISRLSGVLLGRGVKIDLFTSVESNVRISDFCDISSSFIGQGTYLAEHATLRHTRIGRFCSIADNVRTGNGSHPTRNFVSTHPAFFSPIKQAGFSFVDRPLFGELPRVPGSSFVVEIGNDVWLGSGVRLLDGVRIGDGAIIGAGAIVTCDVEPYAIYVGVPARRIRYRFSPEQISFLLDFAWWNRDLSWLQSNSKYFTDIESFYDRFVAGIRVTKNEYGIPK